MNRREALAALMSLPSVARIQTTALKPDDVIVIECEGHLSMDTAKRIKDACEGVFAGRKVLVLSESMKLKVVSGMPTVPPNREGRF